MGAGSTKPTEPVYEPKPVYDPVDDLIICYDGTWCGEATGTTGNMKILADIFASHGKPKGWPGLEKKDVERLEKPKETKKPTQGDEERLTKEYKERHTKGYEERLKLGPPEHPRDVLVRYFEGPGIDGSLGAYLLNGALALDIKKHTVDAYETIVQHYKEGTRVWLFGLSRGAYLVRSVAGIVHNLGILDISKDEKATIPLAKEDHYMYMDNLRMRVEGMYDVYRNPDPKYKPNALWCQSFRAVHSWSTEVDVTDKEGKPVKVKEGPIYLMGLLDTVGALGIPMLNAGGRLSYGLYDQVVSEDVQRCYQALSLTDRLAPFEPCFIRRADDEEEGKDKEEKQKQKPNPNVHPCEEVWFPGSHYDIGRQKFQLLRKFVPDDEYLRENNKNILIRPLTRLLGVVGRPAEDSARWLLSLAFEVNYTPALSNPPLLYLLRRVYENDVKGLPSLLPGDPLSDFQGYLKSFAKDNSADAHRGRFFHTIDAYDEIFDELDKHTVGGFLKGLVDTFVGSQVLADRQVPAYGNKPDKYRRFFYKGADALQKRPGTNLAYRSKSFQTFCALKENVDPEHLPAGWYYTDDIPAPIKKQ